MTQDELINLLQAHEWRDVEFKEAKRAVPRSAYETVSAFANTEGGHLVFGVRKDRQDIEIIGVLDIDKVQNEFLSTLRSREKVSVNVGVQEELHRLDGSDLLIFYIPEVSRSEKPVYLNGDLRRAFLRSGGCDVRCSDIELNRFLTDAATDRYDSQLIETDLKTAFDVDSLKWYRTVYENRPGNRSQASLTDMEFLEQMGLLVERQGRRYPSRAASLLFGSNAIFRQILPRPVVDCQRFARSRDRSDTDERWIDRVVLEENLIRSWQALVDWYWKLADQPFRVDPVTLQREDTPPDYRAFREAMINLLMHQDYADHSRKPEIRHFADQTVFWNPGDAFANAADLLEPGQKEVRNPRVVTAFRRIGLSENAGWGLRDIHRNWQQLGYVLPDIANDKGRKSFELTLKREALLSERQILFQASLGVQLTEAQERIFALACQEKIVTLSQIKMVTGLPGPDALVLADSLVAQVLLRVVRERSAFALVDHLKQQLHPRGEGGSLIEGVSHTSSDIDLASAQLEELTETQYRLLALCETPRALMDLLTEMGSTNRAHFRKNQLKPLMEAGLLVMTKPDTPRAKDQKYVVTHSGLAIVQRQSRNL